VPVFEVAGVVAVVAFHQVGGDVAAFASAGFAVDEGEVAVPVGVGFGGGVDGEEEAAAVAVGERKEERGGVGRVEEVGDDDAEGAGAPGDGGEGGRAGGGVGEVDSPA